MSIAGLAASGVSCVWVRKSTPSHTKATKIVRWFIASFPVLRCHRLVPLAGRVGGDRAVCLESILCREQNCDRTMAALWAELFV
jgi:hypothetical protein